MSADSIFCKDSITLEDLARFAKTIARNLEPSDIITLSGEVGTGKTTLARMIIQELAPHIAEVTSPTFTLMQSYDVTLSGKSAATLWHLDLYRLESVHELDALGMEDIWPHVVLIEWPELAAPLLPENRLEITLAAGNSPDSRRLSAHGHMKWKGIMANSL